MYLTIVCIAAVLGGAGAVWFKRGSFAVWGVLVVAMFGALGPGWAMQPIGTALLGLIGLALGAAFVSLFNRW